MNSHEAFKRYWQKTADLQKVEWPVSVLINFSK